MTELPPEPHPLDADDCFEFSREPSREGAKAGSRLLRLCLIVLIASAGVAFLSGVAASNASPNSPVENIGSAANRISAVVMLVAFCGILLAYRLPQWKNAAFDVDSLLWLRSGYLTLCFANGAGLGIALGIGWLVAPLLGNSLSGIVAALLCIYIALLVTMVAWHTGFVKAYAIGVLTVMGLEAIPFLSLVSAWTYGQLRGGRAFNWQWSVMLLTAVAAGLICAGYVRLLEWYRPPKTYRKTSLPLPLKKPRN